MWDLIVSVPDHCLSFYFESFAYLKFATFQYFFAGLRCRVIIGSLMRLYWSKLRSLTHPFFLVIWVPFWFILIFEYTIYLEFAKLQFVSYSFRFRVITSSLVRLYWPKLRSIKHLLSYECFHSKMFTGDTSERHLTWALKELIFYFYLPSLQLVFCRVAVVKRIPVDQP